MPDSFVVPVSRLDGTLVEAILEPASVDDMPVDWLCNWPQIWKNSDFDCQAIVKMSVDSMLWGLIRFTLFPYPYTKDNPKFLHIENLESHPSRALNRSGVLTEQRQFQVEPVGRWLIWYACWVALDRCSSDQPLVTLSSSGEVVGYYRDTIGMNYAGVATAAPGEDGYAFTFAKSEAMAFCDRIQVKYGCARRFDHK